MAWSDLRERALLVPARKWLEPPRVLVDPVAAGEAPWERVDFAGRDGLPLTGWLAGSAEAPAVVVFCHGYQSSIDETLGTADVLWKRGFAVFTFDFRACGWSGGRFTTMGIEETNDLLSALDVVAGRFPDRPIGVHGFSMGGSVALQAAAQDRRIGAVSTDSAFATLDSAIDAHFQSGPAIPIWAYRLSQRCAEGVLGLRAADYRPVDSLGQLGHLPLLLIHSRCDRLVPYADFEALRAAHPGPLETWALEDTPHCQARYDDWPAYVSRVDGFFRRWLLAGSSPK
jgi:pimeloyl-ACP methyl ester carboxylesterase